MKSKLSAALALVAVTSSLAGGMALCSIVPAQADIIFALELAGAERVPIATMRLDVIGDGRRLNATIGETVPTERMLLSCSLRSRCQRAVV